MAVRYLNASWIKISVLSERAIYLLVIILQAILITQAASNRHQQQQSQMSNLCGPERITLSAHNPEYMFAFPDERYTQEHSTNLVRLEFSKDSNINNENTNINNKNNNNTSQIKANFKNDSVVDVSSPTIDQTHPYRCRWVITTDSNHAITAIFEFTSSQTTSYWLSAEDDFGFIDNCTSNRCLFESPTPALSLDFYTTQLNKALGTRFTAKLYSTSTAFDEEHSLITDWGIVLVVTAVFLIVLLSISYLFYMKRNLLLRRIFNLLSNSDASKSAQAKKKEASGCDKTAPIYRRQPRTSIPSVHIPNFEPMPTIAEEDNEVAESDASSVPNSRRNSSLERPSIRVL